jgi:antitoxin (DNA-binding transcriptional repressor) of toxin-antitoxin stability system
MTRGDHRVKSLNVSEFREQCLTLFERLPAEGILVTKRGEAIARVMPIRKDNADLIGSLAGTLEIRGHIFSTGEEWDAQS